MMGERSKCPFQPAHLASETVLVLLCLETHDSVAAILGGKWLNLGLIEESLLRLRLVEIDGAGLFVDD